MSRRVRTIRMYENADLCGHWYVDDADQEIRLLDGWAMTEDEYYDSHHMDTYGEVELCLLSDFEWGIEYWCSRDHEWEDGESRRACERLHASKVRELR